MSVLLVSMGAVMAATPENLVSWWKFEGNANDETGVNNGTEVGYPTSYVPGIVGQALSFDGVDDYVSVSDSESLDITNYTLELWIEANNFDNTYPTLLNHRTQSATVGYYWIWIKSHAIVLTYTDGTDARSEYWATEFLDGEQYHIALTKSGSSFTMYKDGSSLGERNLDYMNAVYGDLFIGTYQGRINSRYNFDGLIDEVRIWNVALSANELNDGDIDGVKDDIDMCPGTSADTLTLPKGIGTNRWIWNGTTWETKLPKGVGPEKSFTMENTRGCSCEQILGEMDGKKTGHHKFGCSISVMEDFIAGLPLLLVDTVEVPSDGSTVTSISLDNDVDYLFEASGTYRFANWGVYGIADAEWAYRRAPYYPTDSSYEDVVPDEGSTTSGWVKGEGYYISECGLDVQVNGSCVEWGNYNDAHDYVLEYTGNDNPVSFHIHDSAYGDNSEFITVDIYEKQ